MSLKCQGDLIVAANVDKSEVIYTLIEPFHPFSGYFATVLCSSIRLCTAWIGGGGLLRKGNAAEITAFDSVPNVFKTWQTPRSKWFRHYEQGGAGPECKALGRSRFEACNALFKEWFWCIEMNERCFVPRQNWCSHRTHAEEKFLMLTKCRIRKNSFFFKAI